MSGVRTRSVWRVAALALAAAIPAGCESSASSSAAITSSDAGADTGDDTTDVDVIGNAGAAPFDSVARRVGLPASGGHCLVADDFDGDGHADLFMTTTAADRTTTVVLYTNDGKGNFQAKPLAPIAFGGKGGEAGACAAGDVDGDGKLDVVLASFGSVELHYLHNIGGGAFEDAQTIDASPALPGAYTTLSIALADFDGDGWLDLFVPPYSFAPAREVRDCHRQDDGYVCAVPSERCAAPPVIFKNLGTTSPGGLGAATKLVEANDCGAANVNAVAITDWNADGKLDVFVANDWGRNRFFVNDGNLQFHDVLPLLGTKPYNSAMGAAIEDFDFDGRPDLYVSDFGSDQFYLGTASGKIAARSVEWAVAPPTRLHSGWAPLAEDFDSDGFVDVFVPSAAFVRSYADLAAVGIGSQLQARVQYDVMLRGDGGRGFAPLFARQTQAAEPFASFGLAAVADFDGDGLLDIAESLGYPTQFELLHNTSAPQHFLDVRVRGRGPNVDAIGAVVTVARPGKPPWKRLVMRARGSVGSSWSTVHFGLGASTAIDRIDVTWSTGSTKTIAAPSADAVLVIDEP